MLAPTADSRELGTNANKHWKTCWDSLGRPVPVSCGPSRETIDDWRVARRLALAYSIGARKTMWRNSLNKGGPRRSFWISPTNYKLSFGTILDSFAWTSSFYWHTWFSEILSVEFQCWSLLLSESPSCSICWDGRGFSNYRFTSCSFLVVIVGHQNIIMTYICIDS